MVEGQKKIKGPCEIPNCGRAEETGKYHRLIKFQPEIRNTIITSSDSKLSDNSVVCNKCFTNLKRQPDLKRLLNLKRKNSSQNVSFLIALMVLLLILEETKMIFFLMFWNF